MDLCLDVGNSAIFGGVIKEKAIELRFRHATLINGSSDQYGLFLRTVLRENDIEPAQIDRVAICSVVPSLDYSLRAACIKYLAIEPFFLTADSKLNFTIGYQNPQELGADRIANAVAAVAGSSSENLLVVDIGTATTLCAINREGVFLGGAILPGMRLAVEALQSKTAKLSAVELLEPKKAVGDSTKAALQSGLYYMQLGAVRELLAQSKREVFADQPVRVIATGGFSHLFSQQALFDEVNADLVLQGLQLALELNDV